ncbi:hypothetical protein BsWGS_24953 [Bradybaena similaris]
MRHKQPLILTCFRPSLFLLASIVLRQLPVGAESACPYPCTCSVNDHSEVIECNGRNLTSLSYLPDPDTDQKSPVVDIYINKNRFGYILRSSFYAVAGRLRILEIMDNEDNIEVANAAFEPFRESLQVLRIGPLSGDLNEQLMLFSHLTSLVELTISSCSEDIHGGVLFEPLFNEDSDPHLEVLDVRHCGLLDIKNITFRYLKLKVLNLSNNKFTEIPQAVTAIIATSLTHLYLVNNSIGTVKHSYIPHNCKLSVLDLSFNRLTSIDANTLGKCNHLQILNLSYNTGLVSIDSGVFSGLRNLVIDLDHTSIVDLNFIQPYQLLELRIEGSKIACTCHLQLCVMRAFGYRIRGTCVNITTAEDRDLDVSYLDLDCQKDTSAKLEDDIRLTGAEDFDKDPRHCTRQQSLLETTYFSTAPGLPLEIQSTSPVHYPGCIQAASTAVFDVFPDASQSNLKQGEVTLGELGNEGDSYISYFSPTVTASLLLSTTIAKSEEQTMLWSDASDTLPEHATSQKPVFPKKMAQGSILSSSSLPMEDEREQPSSLPSLQVQRLFEEFTTPLMSVVEATLLQQQAATQSKDEPLYSPIAHPESHTLSPQLFSSVYQESTLATFIRSLHSAFTSSPHSLPNTEDKKSPSQSLQPPEVATPTDASTSHVGSESQSELFSGEEAVLPSQIYQGQVSTISPLKYAEAVFASTSSERVHLVEERNPPVWPLEPNAEQSSPLLPLIPTETSKEAGPTEPQQVGSAGPQQAGSTEPQEGSTEPQQVGSTEPQQEGSTEPLQVGSAGLLYQSELTALPQQSESTALYQQSRLAALLHRKRLSVLFQQEGLPTESKKGGLPAPSQQEGFSALSQKEGLFALSQQVGLPTQSKQEGLSALSKEGLSALSNQEGLYTLSKQEGLSAPSQQNGWATLFSAGGHLLAALGINSLQESQPMHLPKRLRHHVTLTESMEPSSTELSDVTVNQCSKDSPAIMPSASTLVSHAHCPEQFDPTHQQVEQPSVTPSPESPASPASKSSRSLRYSVFNRINTNTETRRQIWRNAKLSNRRILNSMKEHPEEFNRERLQLWILRYPICPLVCFIHGFLTFAAFLRLEHGVSK